MLLILAYEITVCRKQNNAFFFLFSFSLTVQTTYVKHKNEKRERKLGGKIVFMQ